ncbi:MAG: NAD-glutamate dehydrogenase [Candidatus Wallbacteria bacterium]|nr:NAD-glutamate dehydrogenase [Candidatus Wallbacteria bacterium]
MEPSLKKTFAAARSRLPAEEQALFASFAECYFPAIPKRYRGFLDGDDLTEFLLGRWQFIKPPLQGWCDVRVYNPVGSQESWNVNITVLEARLADRPFIVDSLKELLRVRGLEIQMTIHPVLVVERDDGGAVRSIASGKSSGSREAFVYLHFDHIESPSDQENLQQATCDVLQMVCAAVDGYSHAQVAVRQVADGLMERPELYPGGRSTQEQKRDFFLWLLDGNFTFLAVRRLVRKGEEFVTEHGSEWGLFSKDRTPPGFVQRLDDELAATFQAALAREFTLTVTRIDLHSPVHRLLGAPGEAQPHPPRPRQDCGGSEDPRIPGKLVLLQDGVLDPDDAPQGSALQLHQ